MKERAAYRTVGAALLACVVLFGAERCLGTGSPDGASLLAAAAALALAAGINFMGARGRILCISALLLLAAAGVSAVGAEESIAFGRAFLFWLTGGGGAPEEWQRGFGLLQTAVIAAACYFVQILFEKLPLAKMVFTGISLAAALLDMFTGRKAGHMGAVFLLGYAILVWEEEIQKRWRKRRTAASGREAHTLWILPFLAVYLAFTAVMPAPEEPYDWQWAKRAFQGISEAFQSFRQNLKWGDREGFGITFGGFSEEGDVGGDLEQSRDEVMRVQVHWDAEPEAGLYLYLTGTVYDTFDGRGWSREREGVPGEVFLDTAQTLYEIRTYNPKYWKDYLKELELEIRYEDFHTGYVFAPLKTWGLEAGENRQNLDDTVAGSLGWKERAGYGTRYVLQYFRLNAGHGEFLRFLEQAGLETVAEDCLNEDERVEFDGSRDGVRADGDIRRDVLQECRRRSGREFTPEDIEDYRESIYGDYLAGTKISEEAADYLEKITEGAETGIEKLRAIEKELSLLSYTLTPGELPERIKTQGDFLDYFLLESRQGYCTYFATAFVLLARAEGIPARYVQGFCVPAEGEGETIVSSGMAHAWPEAYLEGVGWIPFEPTPGYGGRRYSSWEVSQPEDAAWTVEDSGFAENAGAGPEAGGEEKEKEGLETGETAVQDGDAAADRRFSWGLLWKAAGAIFADCCALLTLESAVGRHRYKKRTAAERLRAQVMKNLELLTRLGLDRKAEQETLQELKERAERLPALAERPILGFIDLYEKVLYGGEEAGEDMITETVEAREELLEILGKEKKWAGFYYRIKLYFARYRV